MAEDGVSYFRKSRGKLLRSNIDEVCHLMGRRISILDIGGRSDYWNNVNPNGVDRIILLNLTYNEMHVDDKKNIFDMHVGNACDLSEYGNQSVDFVHSNSVIEHVGSWKNMKSMASEIRRIGRHGWLQTPAHKFPIEPHWRLPFIHWMSRPTQANLLRLKRKFSSLSIDERREIVESVSLLSHQEIQFLFSESKIITEKFVSFPKSYIVTW